MTEEQQFVATLLDHPALHQSTTYKSPIDQRNLEVSFSTTTNFKDDGADRLPTILYLGPMMCSRYLLSNSNALACMKGVRMVFIDRPGFGKSTPVPVEDRLQHVMACIPFVLSDLRVEHVSLMSASAGTPYLLNFLITPSLRTYLHPRRPYVAALVPWVHPDYSKSTLFATAAQLPAAAVGSLGGVVRFIGTTIMPGIGWSSAIFGSIMGGSNKEELEKEDEELLPITGMTKKQIVALDEAIFRRILQEDTGGIGHEALTCVRKNLPPSAWGKVALYTDFVATLAEQEAQRILHQTSIQPSSSGQSEAQPARLRFRTFFASSDIMIGDAGRLYFDKCFNDCAALAASIQYSSSVTKDSNHDSMMHVQTGAIASIFDDVVASWNDQ